MHTNALREALNNRQFIYSAELVLGRDHSVPEFERFIEDAGSDEDGIRVISVTDLPGGRPALLPEFVSQSILEHGLTPIAHLTAKDGNRNLLEGRLHGLASLGVENILAITGDAPQDGFQGRAKPVYDIDVVQLLQLIKTMRVGHTEESEDQIMTPFDFYAGAVVSPFKIREPDQMMQLYKLELKIASGTEYIIPQLGYNLRKLYELKQYMIRESLNHIPVIANIYVPTATVGRMMQSGDIPGCVMPDSLLALLKKEKKPQRIERAAVTVAAVKSLGFAGAHLGGFGLKYKDMIKIIERADEIGDEWKDRMDELVYEVPGEFYLFPEGENGLSDGAAAYQVGTEVDAYKLSWAQRMCLSMNQLIIADGAMGTRFLQGRLGVAEETAEGDKWRHGLWYWLLHHADIFKKKAFGCASCGDCVQDHLGYSSCSMGRCYKETRNGPCGGSREDGTCEMDPEQVCVWNLAYENTLAATKDPRKFATTLIPPRDWTLKETNSMANRLAGVDNYSRRKKVSVSETDASRPEGED